MASVAISDPFFRQLYKRLAEEIDNRIFSLAKGSALALGTGVGLDAITTAMKYQAQVSYIEALQSVIDLGVEIDRERYGDRTNNNDGD